MLTSNSHSHLVVLFDSVGGYHAARLRALAKVCETRNLKLTAVQLTDNPIEHPWGNLEAEITFDLKTLLPSANPHHELRRFLDAVQPDVLAIPGWGDASSRSAQAWATRRGAITVLMSETKRDDAERSWWKEQLKSSLFVRRFDAALVGGEAHRDYLVELAFPRDRIFTGYDVVDNSYFQQRAAAVRSDPSSVYQRDSRIPARPFFLAVTRLIKRKNVLRLVQAFDSYRLQTGPGEAWDLVICGSGEDESVIRETVKELGLGECVRLVGFIGYREIADWYALATVFIHAALQEPWGLVLNEACAAGLPILCSRTVGASQELVRESENGFLFDPKSRADIAQALLRVHHLSGAARKALGAASQRLVAPLNPERFATNFMNAFDAACRRAPIRTSVTAGR